MTKKKIKIVLGDYYCQWLCQCISRQDMYRQMHDDTNNRQMSSIMSRGKFEECKRYLHLCDDDHLNKYDKFA